MPSPLDDLTHAEIEKWIKENYVSPHVAADLAGIKHVTMTKHLRLRRIEGIKIGRSWRVSKRSLQAWLLSERDKGGRPKRINETEEQTEIESD